MGFGWFRSKNGGCAFELKKWLQSLVFSLFWMHSDPVGSWTSDNSFNVYQYVILITSFYDMDLFCYVHLPFIKTVLSKNFPQRRGRKISLGKIIGVFFTPRVSQIQPYIKICNSSLKNVNLGHRCHPELPHTWVSSNLNQVTECVWAFFSYSQ